MLQTQYRPLVNHLATQYGDVNLKHEKGDAVWFCWLQGLEHSPELVKVCLASQKRWVRGKRFKVITSDNYREFVTLPSDIEQKHDRGIIPDAHFTDLIRLELLVKYGGTWIDSTVLFTSSDYPDKIMDCELFFFQYRNRNGKEFLGISNWFISAYSNNQLLMIMRDLLVQYWRDYDCVIYYYIFHLFFGLIAKRFPEKIEDMPKMNSLKAIQMVHWLEKAYDAETMEHFMVQSSIHKLDFRKSKRFTKDKMPTFYSYIIDNYAYI